METIHWVFVGIAVVVAVIVVLLCALNGLAKRNKEFEKHLFNGDDWKANP